MAGLRLVAELGGDGSGFEAMMRRANLIKDRFAASFSGLKSVIAGAFTVGAITQFTRRTIDLASHLRDVSDALGVNVEWFQKRANAARLAGGTEDDLFRFMDQMNRSREAAVQNPKGQEARRLGRLGFSGADIAGLNTMEFFDRLVQAFGDGANTQTVVDVEGVGGRAARNLLAAFQDGFRHEGNVIPEDVIDSLDAIGDEFTILGRRLMVEFAPVLIEVGKMILSFAGYLKQVGVAIGAVTKRVGLRDIAEGMVNPFKFFENIKKIRGAWGEISQEVNSEAAGQQDTRDMWEIARERMREMRRRRSQGAPGFDAPEKRARRAREIPTDSLIRVGNFLGRNPNLVSNIADQQLQVARQHLEVSRTIARRLDPAAARTLQETVFVPST